MLRSMPPAPPTCHGSPSRPITSDSSRAWTAESAAMSTAALCVCSVRRLPRQAEVGLHLASLFGEDQRQHGRGTERLRDPGQQPRARATRVGRQRTAGARETAPPTARCGGPRPRRAARRDRRARGSCRRSASCAVEPRRVPLVGVVLVPALVGLRGPRVRACAMLGLRQCRWSSMSRRMPRGAASQACRRVRALGADQRARRRACWPRSSIRTRSRHWWQVGALGHDAAADGRLRGRVGADAGRRRRARTARRRLPRHGDGIPARAASCSSPTRGGCRPTAIRSVRWRSTVSCRDGGSGVPAARQADRIRGHAALAALLRGHRQRLALVARRAEGATWRTA